MKKIWHITVLTLLLIFSTTAIAAAGGRYYGYGHHSYGSHYSSKYYGHRHSSGDVWAVLGIGLLSGLLFSAIINSQPRERTRTVVYHAAPRYQPPQYTYSSVVPLPPQPELILHQVEITVPLLNLRSTPDLAAPVSLQLHEGAQVGVIGAAPEWLYIKTEEGNYGWIKEQYTRMLSSLPSSAASG